MRSNLFLDPAEEGADGLAHFFDLRSVLGFAVCEQLLLAVLVILDEFINERTVLDALQNLFYGGLPHDLSHQEVHNKRNHDLFLFRI